MRSDVVAIDRVNNLAREGALTAASAFERLSGEPVRVDSTDLEVIQRARLDRRYETSEYVGAHASFSGPTDGTAVFAMARSDASTIASSVGTDSDGPNPVFASIGPVVADGFGEVITATTGSMGDLAAPTSVDTYRARMIPESAKHDEWLVTLTTEFKLPEDAVRLEIVLVPDAGVLSTAGGSRGQVTSVAERLSTIGELTEAGAETAAEHVSRMTGLDASVTVRGITFAEIKSMMDDLEPGLAVGTVIEIEETSNGYFALLFDERAATTVADAVLPDMIGDSPIWAGMGQSAISEIGNVITSGFIDGWSDAMDGTLAHSPPYFVADDRIALISSLSPEVSVEEIAGFMVDTEITLGGGSVDGTFHGVPTRDGLNLALNQLMFQPLQGEQDA